MHGELEFCVFRESSNCIFWNALPGVYNKGICLVSIIAWWWSVLCVHRDCYGDLRVCCERRSITSDESRSHY